MANFAKEQLMKYGWTEGKGLGKNESGITEPVKLATNQNKAGIGYNENEPWWERLFNDASKNVKIESHDNEVFLNIVKDSSALHPENKQLLIFSEKTTHRINLQRFVEAEQITKTCAHVADLKLNEVISTKLHCNKTANDTMNLMPSGKLERIAEQDRVLLNTESPFDATVTGENIMTYRKTNAESDVEESEHEIDNNASILQSIEETKDFTVLSRSTKKKHRKRINKLVQQLDTCNLEEKPSSKLSSKEFLESILKKEKKMNSNVIYTKNYRMKPYEEMYYRSKRWPRDQTFDTKSNNQKVKSERCIGRKCICESERLRRVELSSELRNSIEGNGMTNEQYKDWVILDLTKDPKPSCVNPKVSSNKQQNVARLKFKIIRNAVRTDPVENSYQDLINSLRNKIQKRKNQQCRSKNIKKIVEKLKGEALECELNSVIKNLTAFGLTEKVNVKTMKMRPTQNHLTPV